mmetsp:Transcript_8299/g.15025  ORF Transcript_8299/g.15025 Transcript_8299/m.15025 type:complete len:202 (-) Transcript_8299:512-1117(-)
MIGNPILRIIIRSYPLTPIAPAHQRASSRTPILQRLLFSELMHPRRHQLQALGLVLMLTPLFLHVGHDSRGDMRHSYCTFGGIHMLTACAACSHRIDFDFGGWQGGGDLIVREGREDGHGHGGGLHFDIVLRDTLDAMYARFELEEAVRSELLEEALCHVLFRVRIVGIKAAIPSGRATAATSGYNQTGLLHSPQICSIDR